MAEQFSCALLLLAAGESRRMGRPKQLLPVGGRPLLRHVAEIALAAPVSPVIVVLGAHAKEISPCLAGLAVRVAVNERWAEGMGSSIRTGLHALAAQQSTPDGVIIALADQPDFPATHLASLIETRCATGKPIVASAANGVLRPPVLFAAAWFPRLLELHGDAGARALLQAHPESVAAVPLATSADLDTPADYERFRRGQA
ncbi:MAG: nucleotidyltransferase family protein [Opitutae bacterium]|nr:nucleotidyltransferase family protein [Opitutae bacterium]